MYKLYILYKLDDEWWEGPVFSEYDQAEFYALTEGDHVLEYKIEEIGDDAGNGSKTIEKRG